MNAQLIGMYPCSRSLLDKRFQITKLYIDHASAIAAYKMIVRDYRLVVSVSSVGNGYLPYLPRFTHQVEISVDRSNRYRRHLFLRLEIDYVGGRVAAVGPDNIEYYLSLLCDFNHLPNQD